MNLLSGLVLMLWAVVAFVSLEYECHVRPRRWYTLTITVLVCSASLGCSLWQLAVAIGGTR